MPYYPPSNHCVLIEHVPQLQWQLWEAFTLEKLTRRRNPLDVVAVSADSHIAVVLRRENLVLVRMVILLNSG